MWYLIGSFLTSFSWNMISICPCLFITGLGLGGEYTSITSAIDEFMPSRYRGFLDSIINGTYWVGVAIGCALSLLYLNLELFSWTMGWRLCFLTGTFLGVAIIIARYFLPESPRWLMTHGRIDEAEKIVRSIERRVQSYTRKRLQDVPDSKLIAITE